MWVTYAITIYISVRFRLEQDAEIREQTHSQRCDEIEYNHAYL